MYYLYFDDNITISLTFNKTKDFIECISLRRLGKNHTSIVVNILNPDETTYICNQNNETIEYSERVLRFLKAWIIRMNMCFNKNLVKYVECLTTYYNYTTLKVRNASCMFEMDGFFVEATYMGYGHLEYPDNTKSDTGFLFAELRIGTDDKLFFDSDLQHTIGRVCVMPDLDLTVVDCIADTSGYENQSIYACRDKQEFITFVAETMPEFIQEPEKWGLEEIL